MFQATRSNLGRRIIFLVAVSVLLVLAGLGLSGWQAVRQSSEQVFHERQALALATGTYLDYILRQNLERLDSISFAPGVDIEDGDPEPEKRALHSAYLGSIFNDGVFIADQRDIVLWVEPFRQAFIGANITGYPLLQQANGSLKPSISNVFKAGSPAKDIILVVTPLRNPSGKVVGLVGGQIDLAERSLPIFSQPTELGETSYIDITDSNGVILASSDPTHIMQKSLGGNNQQAIATEPAALATAPWSVVIGQSKDEAMAPVRAIQQRFIIFGFSAVALALLLSWGMARSLVKPIGQLTAAAETISRGNLEQSVPQLGSDEIGKLSRSFDAMRVALRDSLEEIQTWNKALESKV
ncbi:MAG TPA: HAMP domain-containing protein, partial [Dehalococcoidales bacterium]|nr:HAMP domain-containing protein [Dehalococcoidales bacterium]